jgi:phage/plasmid-associated DNA primase
MIKMNKDWIRFRVKVEKVNGKKKVSNFIKKWQDLEESVYNNEPNYAILTGYKNNITVIDIDKSPNDSGIKYFEKNICDINEINTLTTRTISGGFHIYFKYKKELKTTSKMNGVSIDIRNDKGCIIEGEGYPILLNKEVRELTEREMRILLGREKRERENEKREKGANVVKKASKLLKIPDTTEWAVVKQEKGHKLVPGCLECLINPCKKHSHLEHSSLFINHDKSIIKSCFSCGSQVVDKSDSKKLMNYFQVILESQENNIYQELVKDLISISAEKEYKREKNTGIVYKKVKKYAYQKYLEPMDFLNEIFLDDKDFISNVNNMDNLMKFMKQYNNSEFSFIEYNKEYIGFKNGVLNIKTCEFIEIPKEDLVVYKYIDKEFKYSTETPLIDSVLDYQFEPIVREFIYTCLGRMFGIRDNYEFMLYLLGEPGCGKSLIINILCECFNNIGTIGSTFEEKFGLGFLYNKDIVVCDDLPRNISKLFTQDLFQTCTSGGKVPIAIKGGEGFSTEWKVPMLWAGNWFPDYIDKGQISRRLLVANFERNVYNPDPSLKNRILNNELPAFIYKCLLNYNNTLKKYDSNKGIWKICPHYFLEQQEELREERNPLYKFLKENTQYKKDNIILIEDIRENFNNWLGKKVKKLDNGTFGQVNKEYVIEALHICKHCKNPAVSGCCVNYNSRDRSKKKIVRNVEWKG